MDKLKKYVIVLDGIDKTGKDLIAKYIFELSKKKYIVIARGIISMLAYAKIYNRHYEYDLEKEKNSPVLNILLYANKEDWKIRCKYSNEPEINYEEHTNAFTQAALMLINSGISVFSYNTSNMTPYNIAKEIIYLMDIINLKESEIK